MKYYFISFSLLIVLIIVNGCQSEPDAYFTNNKTCAFPNEVITFQNRTMNASEYLWDFGDGSTSNEQDPTHSYQTPGTYEVRMTALSKSGNKNDVYTTSIPVIENAFYLYGNVYPIENACLENYGWNYGNPNGHQFTLYLTGSGILETDTGLTGYGNLVWYSLFSPSADSLSEGTYQKNCDDLSAPYTSCTSYINIADLNDTLYHCYEIVEGLFNVSREGNQYIFEASATADWGNYSTSLFKMLFMDTVTYRDCRDKGKKTYK
jgi:PKD repeat protein